MYMRRRLDTRPLLLLALFACDAKDPDDAGTDMSTAADDESGDGDSGDGDSGDGDSGGEDDGEDDDDATCEGQLTGNYPGDCECVAPGEPCFQGCVSPDGVLTCDEVCAGLGRSCVARACAGGETSVEGVGEQCPSGSLEITDHSNQDCDEPIPMNGNNVECCCSQ